jgi:predicted enzyme related to lactoylglutathione lyase
MTTSHPVVWFEVLGKDGAKLQRFYGELFGWKIDAANPMKYGMVDTGTKTGIPGGVATAFSERSWATFYVHADDVDGALARAQKLGAKVVTAPMDIPDGPRIAIFEDPEGHVVGLVKDKNASA